MNDSFYEQFLPRKQTGKDQITLALMILGMFLLIFIGFLFLGILITVPAIIVIYLFCSYVLPRTRKEYEYSLSNHYLDIALIYNKENRKELVSLDLLNAELIAPTDSPRLAGYPSAKILNCTSNRKNGNCYSIIIRLNNVLHNLLIEPDDKLLSSLKSWSGSKFYQD